MLDSYLIRLGIIMVENQHSNNLFGAFVLVLLYKIIENRPQPTQLPQGLEQGSAK